MDLLSKFLSSLDDFNDVVNLGWPEYQHNHQRDNTLGLGCQRSLLRHQMTVLLT